MAKKRETAANLGFEEQLWKAADKLRGNMDAAEYKHVVLGLIFLKYISDAFEARREEIAEMYAAPESEWYVADATEREQYLEDRDEYASQNVFWVAREARWEQLQDKAKRAGIGKLVDDAMVAIERANPTLKGVLPKDYARPALDKTRLGEVIDLIGNIGLGTKEAQSKDILGRVYEYFLKLFASAEGRRGGQFYTPRCVVRTLVEMLASYNGRVYDPCCGSGGMFVQSEEFAEAHDGRLGDVSVYGQESNATTWRLAKMNLAIRGIEANLGGEHADSFHRDLHKDLKADYVIANPPFNDSDWGGENVCGRTCGGSTACRPPATPTSPGSSTSFTTSGRMAWRGSCWRTVRCRRISPARGRSARPSSRPTWWTAWWPCRDSCSIPPRSRSVCGFWPAIAQAASFATDEAKCCSSMPAR